MMPKLHSTPIWTGTEERDMSTICCTPVITLHRPWWLRWVDAGLERLHATPPAEQAMTPVDWHTLRQLDERTLRDIGAPSWLHEDERSAPLQLLERGVRW
jgi:hypothetical protein